MWFEAGLYGIGITCGAVSGGLEALDFDMAETFWPWVKLIGHSIFRKLSIVRTPSGGWHAIYRCQEICGSRKIASWEAPQSISQQLTGHRDGTNFQSIGKGVRIETRGEGAYLLGPGSPCTAHASGIPYVQVNGPPLPNVQRVTPQERRTMWIAAKEFDCGADQGSNRIRKAMQKLSAKYSTNQTACSDKESPWDWFDKHGNVVALLEKHDYETFDNIRWRRPGKHTGGHSAVLQESPGSHVLIFTSFSTSDGKLGPRGGESHRSFGPFALLSHLEFGGDRQAAARYVRRELMP